MKNIILATAFVATLGACAGRDAQPVQIAQPNDHLKTCGQLSAEMVGVRQQALALRGESDSTQAANIAIGAAGILLFPPLLFAMDLTGADKAEADALEARANMLQTYIVQKEYQA